MRFILAMALLSTMTSVYAKADKVSDLMYLTKGTDFLYSANFNYAVSEYDSNVPAVTYLRSYENTDIEFAESIKYGLSDKFQFGLDLTYKIKDESKQTSETTAGVVGVAGVDFNSTAVDDSGLQDPTLSVRYRALERSTLLLDLEAGFSPSLGDREEGDTYSSDKATEGNAYRGGHQALVAAEVGSAGGNTQWAAALQVAHNFEKTVITKGFLLDYTATIDPYMDITLNLSGQHYFTKELAIGAALSAIKSGEQKRTPAVAPTLVQTTEDHMDFSINVNTKYAFTSNVIGNFSVDYAKIGDYEVATFGSTTPVQVEKFSKLGLGVGIDILF